VWDLYRPEFGLAEEQLPLPPTFETFGHNPQLVPPVSFRLLTAADLPRMFFLNQDRTRLIQVQRDRFIHNWRKVGIDDSYPRYEGMRDTFRSGLENFMTYIEGAKLGLVEPTQCEVTYINHIIVPPETTSFEVTDTMFGRFVDRSTVPGLGRPEDGRFTLRYVIRGNDNRPLGRLVVTSEPVWRADGCQVVQFVLAARGAPTTPTLDAVIDFLNRGREYIVHGFKALTSNEMHNKWELKP
jgi:uncharacterized protein (TIGR04255 family)